MYRGWTRDRSIGGKMLKILAVIFSFILALNVWACWKVEGNLAVDGETFKLNQKFVHGKDYSFPMGSFILSLSIHQRKNGNNVVKYLLQEKKGASLVLVTKGEEEIKNESSKDIFAKGEEGQPNSIITLKINHI